MRIKDSKNKILFIIIILFILLFSRAYATIEKLSDSDRLSPLKTDNFTQKEWREIKQDGYMAYFYRRKYSKEEIMAVWKGVNELCPDYSREEKLLATRSILNYHWVVYRTTPFHNLAANVKVTRKYQHLIDKYSQLHQVPAKMVRGIITWENSGGTTKESWAACAGVGQLSRGAVKTAHEFYIPFVKRSRELADDYYQITRQTGFPLFNALARYHENDSEKFNVAEKHRQLRLKYKVEDERHIPECNLEDAVVYLKLLYNNYNQRMDLAISAYHNGGLNNNDIIRNYIKRNHGLLLDPSVEQTRIVEALDKHKIKFIDLWDDNISRDMLNGLRTVYGHQTNSYNRHLSLGDESDIYPWKIIAAYSILSAPGETLKRLVKKYEGPWDVAELRGMKVYKTIPEVRQAIKEGRLVKLPPVYKDHGISKINSPSNEYKTRNYQYNYYVLPETAGFLIKLNQVLQNRSGNNKVKIPLKACLETRILENKDLEEIPSEKITHLQGAAIEIDMDKAPYRNILEQIINEGYLHDKVLVASNNGRRRLCVNPRYGKHFYDIYRKYSKK